MSLSCRIGSYGTSISGHGNYPSYLRLFSRCLVSVLSSYWRHRHLILQMARRDVIGRYRGSVLGLAWSFLTPLLMLSVYTFLFGVVFKSRWGAVRERGRSGTR